MRVLVVDDSTLFRRVMSDVLASMPGIEVVGQAQNGSLAVRKVRDLRPDLVTLDMEMPEMDGLAVLDALKANGSPPAVIVVSALTRQGGELTLKALQKGAFDFITKPDAGTAEESRDALAAQMASRLKALSLRLGVRDVLRGGMRARPQEGPGHAVAGPASARDVVVGRMERLAGTARPGMVLIGVSTGGPNALAVLLPALPRMGVPVLIVQHMPPVFTQSLAVSLAGKCVLGVREAADGETAEADTVYIAPGGRQMRLAPGPGESRTIQITDDPPENNCSPSVDYLFRSVANQFPGRAMAVILTGMGSDGTLGLRLLKRHGCHVIAQEESSCVVYGMPKSAVDAGVVDEVLPLQEIAGRIAVIVGTGR